jgi:hypothetical protein
MAIFGIIAIVFGFINRAPRLLKWIYELGNGAAWSIKIGLVVVGGCFILFSGKKTKSSMD